MLTELADALADPAERMKVSALISVLEDDAIIQRPDKEWSLTDCISFTVMQERHLQDAWTGDHHLEQAGFKAVFRQS